MNDGSNDFIEAQNGNTLAFKKLFTRYQPVVFKLKRKYFVRELDEDDWEQEGRIIFFKSLKTFDQSRGLTFGCFFRMNLERHIYSLLRKQNAEKRKTELITDSFEENSEKNNGSPHFFEKVTGSSSYEYVAIRDVLHGFEKTLSPFECKVFRKMLDGRSVKEIMSDVQRSEMQVKNALDRIKRKFKDTIR